MPKSEPESVQRWLTLDEMAATLRLPKSIIPNLVAQGVLVTIRATGRHGKAQSRFLDPTPEYARQLRLGALIHSKVFPIESDLSTVELLTVSEVAEICGWTVYYARKFVREQHIPHVAVTKTIHLYTVKTVREILWRRQGRTLAKQRSPFLIARLIEWFRGRHEQANRDMPSDAEFLLDDAMQRKLQMIVDMSDSLRSQAQYDLAAKVELAQKILQILEEAETPSNSLSTLIPAGRESYSRGPDSERPPT